MLCASPAGTPRARLRTFGGRHDHRRGPRARAVDGFLPQRDDRRAGRRSSARSPAAFVALNLVFASFTRSARIRVANARPGNFADLFFFSVETTSTVGYGDMHPQTLYGHLVATVENFIGMVLFAVMTGLIFARFSRPRARLDLRPQSGDRRPRRRADPDLPPRQRAQRLHHRGDGKAVDARPNADRAKGGASSAFEPMRLVKSENPALALSWTLFHPIDDAKPALSA